MNRAWIKKWMAGVGLASICLTTGPSACGPEYNEQWSAPYRVSEPYKVNQGALVYINHTFGEVLRISPTRFAGDLTIERDRVLLGENLTTSLLSDDRDTLYILDAEKLLHIVDLSGEKISAKSIELSSAYDRITLDPKGDFLLLSFGSADTGRQVIARNLNEVGIVDLREQELAARFVTLASKAQELIFAPEFELGGESRRLVAALADSEVTLIDLLATDERNALREVPLTLSEAESVKRPVQALFDVTPDESLPDTASLYVLTDRGSDITQIAIQPSVRQDSPFTFDLSVNQLAAGKNPGRMALIELPERGTRLLALDRSSPRFSLVDVSSGETATFSLPTSGPASSLMVYTANRQDGVEEIPEQRVLAYSANSAIVTVIRPETISISGDQPTLGRSVEAIRLERTPRALEYDPSAAADHAVVFHEGLTGGFSVLNLQSNRDIPIEGFALNDVLFDGAYAYGSLQGTENLVVFELATGHPTVFELPYIADAVTLDAQEGLLLVENVGDGGNFTVLDAEQPDASDAVVIRGAFWDGVLNRFDEEGE